MSLPVLAQHMASKGRGDDSMLVHMTPGEVHGLQALAMAHGGSLTVNPDTGLPEAGFLKSILPAILGFALAPLTAGTSLAFLGTPLGAAATVGGIGALATGSLKEGLMMGLGAYGGAGLGSSLASAGTGALSQAAGQVGAAGANIATLPTASAADIAAMADVGMGAGSSAAGVGAGAGTGVITSPVSTPSITGTDLGQLGAPSTYLGPSSEAGIGTAQQMLPAAAPTTAATTPTSFGPLTDAQAAPLKAYDLEMAQQRAVGNALAKATPTDTLKAGFESAAKDPSKFLTKQNLQYGLAAMSPMMMATNTVPGQDEDDDAMIRPYRFDPVSGQYTRLAPYPAKQANKRFADGGLAEQVRRSIDSAAPETQADDPVSRYRQMVMQEYANIGRTGFGTGNTQVDQPGYDYWVSQLESGNLQPENFRSAFRAELDRTISQNPEDAYSRQVSSYLNPAPPPPRTPTSQYDTMTGDSAAAYDYLMGKGAYPIRTTQPRVAAPYAEAVMGIAPDPTTQRYLWDESIGRYYVNPNYEPSIRDRRNADADAAPAPAPAPADSGNSYAPGGIVALAGGGMQSHLGDYSDGGRLLKGPGDGVSDSIPAVIANKRPARLADGEFVVPARVVSELGNGSTEAGARKLYAMMDRIQKNRSKTVGKGKVAVNSRSEKYLPA